MCNHIPVNKHVEVPVQRRDKVMCGFLNDCAFYRSFELCMCMIKYLLCRFLPVQVTTLASGGTVER